MAFGSNVPSTGTTYSQLVNDEPTNVVICTPVYSDGPGTFKMALGDGSAKSKGIGVVIDVAIKPGASGNVLRVGVVTATTAQWDAVCGTSGGLVYGTLYYLSTTVPGALTTSSASNVSVIFGLGPTVGAIITGGGSGGVTNGAANHVMMVSDGTNAVGSGQSDDGTIFKSTRQVQIGPTAPSSSQPVLITRGATTDTAQVWIQSDDTNHVGSLGNNEMIQLVLRNNTTFDTTAGSGHASAIDIVVNGTIAAGANPLENIGIAIAGHVTGAGVSNFAIKSTDTVAIVQHDGPTALGGPSGTSVVGLGNAVKRFTVLDASPTTITPQLDIGVVAPVDGYNMHVKNTATGVSAMGIALQGDTAVTAAVAPQIVLYRNAGGLGSQFGIIGMDNGSGAILGAAGASDIVIANYATSKKVHLAAGGNLGLSVDSAGNVVLANAVLQIGGTSGTRIRSGALTPNTNVVGSIGDLYTWTGGGAGTTLWVKESGAATNTGWVAK